MIFDLGELIHGFINSDIYEHLAEQQYGTDEGKGEISKEYRIKKIPHSFILLSHFQSSRDAGYTGNRTFQAFQRWL